MRYILSFAIALSFLFTACDEDNSVFEKDADTRVAEAIDSLKTKLVAPPDGWLLKYRPDPDFGAYYVLLNFEENGEVNIQTDLGVNDGEFFDQTITYRIDNSLGLELIFENYSFFSFLFEQSSAQFPAEFEFNYVNETGDGDLVFSSKSDVATPSRIVLQKAVPENENLLGTSISENLNKMNTGLPPETSVLKLSYLDPNTDVVVYMNFDDLFVENFNRIVDITYISSKTSVRNGQRLDFSTGYTLEGNSIILDEALVGSFNGKSINIEEISLNEFSETSSQVCNDALTIYNYSGQLSGGELISLETSVFDPEGAVFTQSFGFYNASLTDNLISFSNKDDIFLDDQVVEDIPGATSFQMYFGAGQDGSLNGIGFRIANPDASVTFALKEFEYTIDGNRIQFDFEQDYTLFGDTTATIDAAAMDKYLDLFTENDNTYVYRASELLYEIYNPCNGWAFYFFADPDF